MYGVGQAKAAQAPSSRLRDFEVSETRKGLHPSPLPIWNILLVICFVVSCTDIVRAQATPGQAQLANEALGPLPTGDVVLEPNGRMSLPIGHPAYGLQVGQYRSVGGVVIAMEPAPSTRGVRFAGLPERYALNLRASSIDPGGHAQNSGNWTLIHDVAERLATYYGEPLSRSLRESLFALYDSEVNQAHKILSRQLRTESDVMQVRESLAELLSRSVVAEMHILAEVPLARIRRFPYWRGRMIEDPDKFQNFLYKAYLELLDGAYIARDEEKLSTEGLRSKSTFSQAQRRHFKRTPRVESRKAAPFVRERRLLLVSATTRQASLAPQPSESEVTYAWEARIYDAEHSILSGSLEGELQYWARRFDDPALGSDVGLVHVSVLAGIWRLTRILETRPLGGANVGFGQPLRETRLEGRWFRWVVADGSASWLTASDKLMLRERAVFSSYQNAVKYLLGISENSHGFNQMHECAYSVGDYGDNWVCHQNSNAYAFDKWGLILVNKPTVLVFGPVGNYQLPISLLHDPLTGRLENGGAPGLKLHYQTDLPYSFWDNFLNSYMKQGRAFGLNVGWDATDHLWRSTGCHFTPTRIPIGRGEDDPQRVILGWFH